jgi:catechol 2,3-dioxygenase-like lactoylglutathione lyase family enzyme
MSLKIGLTSVLVADQAKALAFYTDTLGFEMKQDFPVGDFRFITVVSPAGPEGIELLLEPNENPAAQVFQKAIYDQGIPATAFFTDDIQAEYERLAGLGVVFSGPPDTSGPVAVAVLDDTCGNLIQIVQG